MLLKSDVKSDEGAAINILQFPSEGSRYPLLVLTITFYIKNCIRFILSYI